MGTCYTLVLQAGDKGFKQTAWSNSFPSETPMCIQCGMDQKISASLRILATSVPSIPTCFPEGRLLWTWFSEASIPPLCSSSRLLASGFALNPSKGQEFLVSNKLNAKPPCRITLLGDSGGIWVDRQGGIENEKVKDQMRRNLMATDIWKQQLLSTKHPLFVPRTTHDGKFIQLF